MNSTTLSPRLPTVDVHAHTGVPAIAALVEGQTGLGVERDEQLATFGLASTRLNIELDRTTYRSPLEDLSTRLTQMDQSGIDAQAVSVAPTLYHYWANPSLAADIVAAANDYIADLVSKEPERIVGLAAVALQHADLAADQLRAATDHGLRGVEISTRVAGRDLSDRSFDPFWAAAEALGSFIFLHPWGCSLGSRLAIAYLGNVVGNPTETTVALHHLIFGGVLDRFPKLRICAAHGGGYFPHYLGRADHAFDVRPESRTMQRKPSEYLDSLYFDSLLYTDDALARLIGVVGHDHVMLGTDYPFDMGVTDPLQRLDAIGLPSQQRATIAGGTAARLLSLNA
jgi:aminocarboxymuconate-semialdehyde decarboxylase